MVSLGGWAPPQCSAKNNASWSKNKKSLGQKLDLVYLYIEDFSILKRIKKQFGQPINHLVSKMTNHDI